MIAERIGNNVELKNGRYRILKRGDHFLLKEILIKKEELKYAFIGGMWYYRGRFSLESDISLPYPFSTYYTIKIPDKIHQGRVCRSLIYVKMPVAVLQFRDRCLCIEFDPVVKIKDKEVFPFVSLDENEEHFVISFHIFNEFFIKTKRNAWLGFGKNRKICLNLKEGDEFKFNVRIREFSDWRACIKRIFLERLPEKVSVDDAEKIFYRGKRALWRSFDELTGTFLQLPWSGTTGFVFVNSSYSLLSFEAVRLYYFTKWYRDSGDRDFLEWSRRLKELFKNPRLYKRDLKKGEGIVWYNMTNLGRKGLEGFFYLDCGYSGYPGGQATIAFNLLRYLEMEEDADLETLVKDSLRYILSTQNANGSWPMAIHQEGMLRFRPEKLEKYETTGGTAECIRALLLGYRMFNDERFLESALKGLRYLSKEYPICYHGLRDIGINEVEAFSAISVIEAFLDAYELMSDESYLEDAINYAFYTLTWFYLCDTESWKMSFNFHPISESITPRLSPYESVLIVSTYFRLYDLTGDEFWSRIARVCYREVTRWISKNGGLCEGIFPDLSDGLRPLPMEQTFATVELMNASTRFFNFSQGFQRSLEEGEELELRASDDKKRVALVYKDKEILAFDVEKFKIVSVCNANLSSYGISISFFDPYSTWNRIKMKIKKLLRGRYGKFILGLGEIGHFIKGVEEPKNRKRLKIKMFENVRKKDFGVEVENGSTVKVFCRTDLHRMESKIKGWFDGKSFHILFDPVIIEVLDHDLYCTKVLFPVIGSKLRSSEEGKLVFDGFVLHMDFDDLVITEDFTAIDQTLSTNWTHGGVYKGRFMIEIPQLK